MNNQGTMNEIDRQRYNIYNRALRNIENSVNLVLSVLTPQTQGLPHINLDMCTAKLNTYEIEYAKALSRVIAYSRLHNFEKSLYSAINNLVTLESISKSKEGAGLSLVNTTITKVEEIFKQTMEKTKPFSLFWGKKKLGGESI